MSSTAKHSLNSSLEVRNLRTQTRQPFRPLRHSTLIAVRLLDHLRVKYMHPCQVALLLKAKASISERGRKKNRCVTSTVVSSFHHPSQSVSSEQTAQLRYQHFPSKSRMRKGNQVLRLNVSQKSILCSQYPQTRRAQQFLLSLRTPRVASNLVGRETLNEAQL